MGALMAPNMGSAAPSRADHGRDRGTGTFRDHGQGEPPDNEPSITVIARSRSERAPQSRRSRHYDRDRDGGITIAVESQGTRTLKTGSNLGRLQATRNLRSGPCCIIEAESMPASDDKPELPKPCFGEPLNAFHTLGFDQRCIEPVA